jgi:hypothetical protein
MPAVCKAPDAYYSRSVDEQKRKEKLRIQQSGDVEASLMPFR